METPEYQIDSNPQPTISFSYFRLCNQRWTSELDINFIHIAANKGLGKNQTNPAPSNVFVKNQTSRLF